MPPKRSPIQLIRNSIQERKKEAFCDAIQQIKPGTFLIESWHECLRTVLSPDFPEDPSFYVSKLLSHGGDENDAHRRLLLNDEIARIGRFEETEEDFRDEEMGQIAQRILREILHLYPNLAWTTANETRRTLFHKAAESGACSVIDIVGSFIREHRGDSGIQSAVRTRDANNQTALVIAVRGNRSSAVNALMKLDPDQLDETSPNSQADIEFAVDGGKLDVLKTLLRDRARLVTHGLFQKALSDSKFDVFEYLMELRPEVLRDPQSNLLVTAVKKGQVNIVELLVKKLPELTSRYEWEKQMGTNVSSNVKKYILSFNSDRYFATEPGTRATIRDLILPVIIERNPISRIREILFDSSDLRRKEICLDLSAYSYDSKGLRRFLRLIKSDLSSRHVQEMPPGSIMAAITAHLQERNIRLTPDVENFISQVYAIAMNLPAQNGEVGLANGSVFPASASSPNGSINGNTVSAISRLLNQSTADLNDSVPSFSVDFEPTLKYVELPSFDDIGNPKREEAKDILDWLRKCKKVTRIFELRAKDSLHLFHSEEIIEETLQGFDIQKLDWQRPDLSVDTIRYAAPNVRTLHLYSSGNWASIDHWTGPNGISTLPRLEKLHLTIINDNITQGRAEKYRNEADRRLAELNPGPERIWERPVVSICPWQSARTVQGEDTTERELLTPIESNKLGYFLPYYKELLNDSEYVDHLRPCRMKVAVIDSGVDRCIFTGDERDVVGASFVHNHNGSKESPWWLAEDHHGSHVAHLIAEIDPCCSIYVAKVTESKNKVDRGRVTQAIRWAINEKVDIINLSLVLYSEDADLLAAIEAADAAGIVVFCATADKGFTPQDIWPAKYANSYDSIFPVCSSTANGRITEYSSETAAQYTFQGEDIIAGSGGIKVSGSSIATAIASGIASLVLTCHRMLLASPGRSKDRSLPALSSKVPVIKKAFTRMCGDVQNKPRPWLVTPSMLFPSNRDDFHLGDPDDVHGWLIERLQDVLAER